MDAVPRYSAMARSKAESFEIPTGNRLSTKTNPHGKHVNIWASLSCVFFIRLCVACVSITVYFQSLLHWF